MKKIILGIFIGCVLCYVNFYPYESELATELSPNGKYKLIYEAERHGGIFPAYYRHYIQVIDTSNNESLFYDFIESDDIKSPYNKAHWDGDTIVVEKDDFYPKENQPYKIETTKGKMVFYFPEGYATK